MEILIVTAACLVAEVLLLSAAYKMTRPYDYMDAVRSYHRLRAVNPAVRSLLAWTTPAGELASAILILVPATRLYGLAVACVVLVAFYVVIGGDDRPVIANCGCWGRTSFGVSRHAVIGRNATLICITVGALTGTAVTSSIGRNQTLETFIAIGMALPLAVLLLQIPELLMLASLRPSDVGPAR